MDLIVGIILFALGVIVIYGLFFWSMKSTKEKNRNSGKNEPKELTEEELAEKKKHAAGFLVTTNWMQGKPPFG